ncbi:hypothetical protein NE237_010295 [Protea cynaroides]|uniref:Disease resistance RPP13-like protein 4 n=1 Tax=Protea cynaroides TaxID=273540 RepID=A0A9Q0R1J0_9MAGN|nr:hypothetical protein NE237_010295 [Protea cynaroides]
MEMSDFQCEETLSAFFNQWKSVEEKIGSKNYDDLIHNIDDNLEEIKKSITSVTKWKKEVTEVFKVLNPKVTQLIKGLENNKGEWVSGNLKHIDENLHQIKNGTQHLVKLPSVEHKKEPKKKQSTCWKKHMFMDKIMASPGMAMAKSTYHGLESRVKLCFLSLSIFPENKVIRKRSLVYWWIGEGFMDGKDAEKEAEECFKKLCQSGLVEAVHKQYSRSPRSCRLHPWIRWMAIEIAKENMFFDFDPDGKPVSGPSHCTRRACVAKCGGEDVEVRVEKVNLKPNASELRSLFNVDVNCIECEEEEFKKMKKLVTLQLGRWSTAPKHHIELVNPAFFDHLKHLKRLRYLGLQGISRITELAGIQQLSELRVLDLRACHNLEKLPVEIASLKKLTHLDVSECYLLEYMPKGLGDLSELQLLNGFVVNTWSQDACNLFELTKLGSLQKLSITLGMEAMVIERVLDPIGEIKCLQSLRITWGTSTTEEENNNGVQKKMITANHENNNGVQQKMITANHENNNGVQQKMITANHENNNGVQQKMITADPAAHSTARWFRVSKAIKKLNIVFLWTRRSAAPEQQPSSKITLVLPPYLTKLDLQCYPEEHPPGFKRKIQAEKRLEKLYFRGGKLKTLNGIQKDEVSKVKFIRLRFLRDFYMNEDEFKNEFPGLKIKVVHKCRLIPEKIASPLKKDEASTNTNPIASADLAVSFH